MVLLWISDGVYIWLAGRRVVVGVLGAREGFSRGGLGSVVKLCMGRYAGMLCLIGWACGLRGGFRSAVRWGVQVLLRVGGCMAGC